MNRDEWHKVEAWVYQALDLARLEQRAMLKALIEEQGELGKAAAELVAAHDHIGNFLDPPFWRDRQLKTKYFSDGNTSPGKEHSVLTQLGRVLACWHEKTKPKAKDKSR